MEHYFLPVQKGGDRLQLIQQFVEGFKEKKQRYADTASRALTIKQIEVMADGQTANAETSEMWYAPRLEFKDGNEVPMKQEPQQINAYTPVQFYILQKVDGRWYIQSNPAPTAQ